MLEGGEWKIRMLVSCRVVGERRIRMQVMIWCDISAHIITILSISVRVSDVGGWGEENFNTGKWQGYPSVGRGVSGKS
jgi:hypothetical protein